MIKILTTFILGILLPTSIFSQDRPKTILWEISGNGLSHKSFLLGTNHSFNWTWIDSFTVIKKKLLDAKYIVVELKGKSKNGDSEPLKTKQDTNHTPLKKLFDPVNYKLVDNYLKEKGLSKLENAPDNFYSVIGLYWATFGKLAQPTEKENTDAIDKYIENLGKEKNSIIYLDEGIGKLRTDSIPELNEKILASLIIWSIKNENNPDSILLITNATKPGLDEFRNLTVDYHLNQNTPIIQGQIERELLLKRNKYWIEKLPSILKNDYCFIAVGLNHLKYKEGLISQLKGLGFTVKPVKIQRIYSR